MTRKKFWIYAVSILIICGGCIWGILSLNRPLVSVVMCVYNGVEAGELNRSIPSILNQSWRDFEFIIVEDGSQDNSWALLQQYAKIDPRIKLVRNDKNRGISYSRNRGNALARGKYIMIMDQDDISLPHRILKQALFMEKQPWYDVAVTPSISKSPWQTLYNEDDVKWLMLFSNNYGHPNVMVKRSFLTKHHIRYNENIKCANDYDWLVQIFENGGRFGTMYDREFIYMGAKLSKNLYCYAEARKVMHKWFPPEEFEKLDKMEFENRSLYNREWLCRTTHRLNQTGQFKDLFTPGYLEYKEKEICALAREK